jgi:hypothetical protein
MNSSKAFDGILIYSEICDDIDENDGISFMHDFSDKQSFNIIIGDFVQTNTKNIFLKV